MTTSATGLRRSCTALLALLAFGCAGHAARTEAARTALDMNDARGAEAAINEQLEVDSSEDLPDQVDDDEALLVLDRSMVLQQLGRYQLSSRDLEFSDKRMEVLDLSRNAVDDLGRYLFSDDTGPYRAPAYEKLLINTMNMVNYLVRSDLNGARIEARRLAVMQKFIKDRQDPGEAFIGAGSYFAGFTFEKSGNPQEALRYYDEALRFGDYRTLHEPIRRLAAEASYRSPRIQRILDAAPPAATGSSPAAETGAADGLADLLVIVNFGRVPAKKARRIPIGLALTYASGALSPTDQARANQLALQGLVTWVNFPELGRPRGQYDQPEFAVGDQWQTLEGILAVDREASRAWEKAKGAVVASAITRMIARVVAGQVVKQADDGPVGLLLGLATQATLTAADTPDTRSWATLPARIAVGRLRLKPGTYWIWLGARGVRKRYRVDLQPGGWAVLNHTVLS